MPKINYPAEGVVVRLLNFEPTLATYGADPNYLLPPMAHYSADSGGRRDRRLNETKPQNK